MRDILASLLEKRGWELKGKSDSGKKIEKFEKNEISETIFRLFCSDSFYRILSMVLFTKSPKNIRDIASELVSFNLKYALKESIIKKFVCKNCGNEYKFPKWEPTKINICQKCGRKSLYVEDYWELKPIDLVVSSLTYYLKNLEEEKVIHRSFETFCPFCLSGSSFEQNDIYIQDLKCRDCRNVMELFWIFSAPEEVSDIWELGIWLEWYLKKLIENRLKIEVLQGVQLKEKHSDLKKEVDCIFAYNDKIISIECKAKKPEHTYNENNNFFDLFNFSDVVIFLTTTKISESFKRKWEKLKPKVKKIFVDGNKIEDLPDIIKEVIK